MPSRWGGGLVGVLVGSGVMYRGENECCCCCRREDFFALSWNREQRAKRVDHPLFAMYTYRERKSVVDREGLKQKNSTSFLLFNWLQWWSYGEAATAALGGTSAQHGGGEGRLPRQALGWRPSSSPATKGKRRPKNRWWETGQGLSESMSLCVSLWVSESKSFIYPGEI